MLAVPIAETVKQRSDVFPVCLYVFFSINQECPDAASVRFGVSVREPIYPCRLEPPVWARLSCVCVSVFVFVRAVKRKRLELSIQKSAEIYSTTGPKHPLTLMSKGDRIS